MSVLIDYRCRECRRREEKWVERPVSAEASCSRCGGVSSRIWGIGGIARGGAPVAPAAPEGAASCLENSGVPAICHMHPSAARRWAAMGRGDTKAEQREIRYQEAAVEAGVLNPKDAIFH